MITHEETRFLQIIHTTPAETILQILAKIGLSEQEIEEFKAIYEME